MIHAHVSCIFIHSITHLHAFFTQRAINCQQVRKLFARKLIECKLGIYTSGFHMERQRTLIESRQTNQKEAARRKSQSQTTALEKISTD